MAKIGRFLIFVTLAVDSHDIPRLLISGWSDCFGTAPGLEQVSDRVRIVVPQGPDGISPVRSAGVGIQKEGRASDGTIDGCFCLQRRMRDQEPIISIVPYGGTDISFCVISQHFVLASFIESLQDQSSRMPKWLNLTPILAAGMRSREQHGNLVAYPPSSRIT